MQRFELKPYLLLGRHAEANHRVTFKMARGRDLWFHLRDGAGSHVILPLNREQSVSDELILVGAALALHYSTLRGERAEVRVAFRRDLDPVPGHPGRVLVRQERTLLVDPRSELTRQTLDALVWVDFLVLLAPTASCVGCWITCSLGCVLSIWTTPSRITPLAAVIQHNRQRVDPLGVRPSRT